MKRRLNLACGMMHQPCALLLDEPTVGVDPQSRGRIFSIVERARDRGEAILYSTHYMEEVERLADRIILIDRGRVVAEGASAALIALAGTEPRIEVTTANPLTPGWAHGVEGVRELTRQGDNGAKVSLALVRVDQAPEILRMAERDGGQVVEFYLHRPNLQDAFLALTGRALRDVP
jgi:ABC-2 type transport system ATP-binding protein